MFAIVNPRKTRRVQRDAGVDRRPTFESLRQRLRSRPADEATALFEQIAAEVAQRRLDWGLSQSELAELCGTTQSAIARLERGARPPRIDTLWRIANALDCQLTVELLPRTRQPKGTKTTEERGR